MTQGIVDHSNSETPPSEGWKNPMFSLEDRLLFADGAVAFERKVLANIRSQLEAAKKDAERYRKLRGWMSSNVEEGWQQVCQLAALACYVDWDAFDETLDGLEECNVGLMTKPKVPYKG